MSNITQALAQELNQPLQYVENVIALLDEGNTIPFIARYRKESHGSMDDTTLRTIELHDVPMQRNRMTAYSGTMFQNTRSVELDFSTDWDAALEVGW